MLERLFLGNDMPWETIQPREILYFITLSVYTVNDFLRTGYFLRTVSKVFT